MNRPVIRTPPPKCHPNHRAPWPRGALLLLALAIGPLTGCTGFAQAEREATQEAKSRDHSGDMALLYQAMLNIHAQRKIPVEVASPEVRLVATPFQELETGLRRRYISRIVEFPGGVALKVTAEYQRLAPSPAPASPVAPSVSQAPEAATSAPPAEAAAMTWQASEEPALRERAAREELELGRAIEREFLRLKKG